jgi:elongation factor Ts
MTITATQVKELRERTGAGMMECKNALAATQGNMDLAIEELRKTGRAKADKKAGRIAAEGIVIIKTSDDGRCAVMVEINSETDFVARDENFMAFADLVAKTALAARIDSMSQLAITPLLGTKTTVEEARQALVAKVGENIHIRRLMLMQESDSGTKVGTYLHGSRIGVMVELDGSLELAKDIAMHVAASKPAVIAPDEVSHDIIEKERTIFMAQAESSGKPADIIEKMVAGRIKKFLDEVSLLGQPFVKDPDIVVASLLSKHKAKVIKFVRFEVGEGIEKEEDNFVEAVMSQVHGT